MKERLSQLYDLKSARLEEPNYKRLLSNQTSTQGEVLSDFRLTYQDEQSPQQLQDVQRRFDFNAMHPQNENPLLRDNEKYYSSNNYGGLQNLNQYLMSDGDELLSETNNLDNLLQSNERPVSSYKRISLGTEANRANTNQTSSSFHNAPMSYSSTNSRGFMNDRFGRLNEMGSPISIQDEAKDTMKLKSDRQGRLSDLGLPQQSSNKKSVKFLDEQNESRILKTGGGDVSILLSGTDNILGSNYKDFEPDTSNFLQAKIDKRMNEINQRYFSNERKQQEERKLKPIIKVQENQSLSNMRDLSQSKTHTQDLMQTVSIDDEDDSDTNSIMAMEQEIEKEKQEVRGQLDRKYFSNHNSEPSLQLNQKPVNSQSVFASTNSFEKLRQEILNNQSTIIDGPGRSELGTQMKSDQQISSQEFVNMKNYALNSIMNQTIETNEQNRDEQQKDLLNRYIPLRKSRDSSLVNSLSPTVPQAALNTIDHQFSRPRDFAQNLLSQNQLYENKLHNLKSKINNLHSQNKDQHQNDFRPLLNSLQGNQMIGSTPTLKDLGITNQRITDDTNQTYQTQEQIVIQTNNEFHTNLTSRDSSRDNREHTPISSNMNTKDLRQKIQELKQSINEQDEQEEHSEQRPRATKVSVRGSSSRRESSSRNTTQSIQKSASFRKNSTQNIATLPSNSLPSQRANQDQFEDPAKEILTRESNRVNQTLDSNQPQRVHNRLQMNAQLRQARKETSSHRESQKQIVAVQEQSQAIESFKKKIQWLEKRNMEYSERLRDLKSEKNNDQLRILDLQKQVKLMVIPQENLTLIQSEQFNYQTRDSKAAQTMESQKIQVLQQQLQDISQMIRLTKIRTSDAEKENYPPNSSTIQHISEAHTQSHSFIDQPSARMQALKVNQIPMAERKSIGGQIPLRSFARKPESCHKRGHEKQTLSAEKRPRSSSKQRVSSSQPRQVNIIVERQQSEKKTKKSKSKSKERKVKSKKSKLMVKQLSKQVVELQKQIQLLQQQSFQQKDSFQNKAVQRAVNKDLIIESLRSFLSKEEGSKEDMLEFKTKLLTLISVDPANETVKNPFSQTQQA